MGESAIDGLDVHPKVIDVLKKAKLVTFEQILSLSLPELETCTGLSEAYAKHLLSTVAHASVSSEFISGLQLLLCDCPLIHQQKKLSFGCPTLNAVFNGGIFTRTITEITGISASGKTQLCLQLSIQAQLPVEKGGLNCDVAYLCTEARFPIKRFNQLVSSFKTANPSFNTVQFADHLAISHVVNLAHMLMCLKQAVPALLKEKNIKLIIIDSVAAIFRSEYESNEYTERARDLENFGIVLWKLANEHGIVVICVNQVTASMKSQVCCEFQNEQNIPALGLMWSNLLTSRVILSRTDQHVVYNSSPNLSPIHNLKIALSSYLPNSSCNFLITEKGVFGLKNT